MISFLVDQSTENLKLQVDGVSSDTVNVSWDGGEFLKIGVDQIRVVAEPSGEPTPIADVVVNASASKVSITNNLRPSTKYMIYVEEYPTTFKLYVIHYITTAKGGELMKHYLSFDCIMNN